MIEIGKTREGIFLIVFLLQFPTFSGFLACHEVTAVPTDAITTMLAILLGMAPLSFLSATNAIVAVEGGEEKGRTDGWHECHAWNQRRLEAEKNGRPFTEPPPSLTTTAM